ncbi:putative alpha-tubulin polyglutamylase Ttll1 [Diplonema papillatum]|nr:putative alpha-tubulin polyglutamylase Ttll1 [Diplonema papillatum]
MSRDSRIRYKIENDKGVLTSNFERRGWQRTQDDDWNIYWCSMWAVKSVFSADGGLRLNDNQVVNHYPNHHELTRKDCMVKNMKRYRKENDKNPGIYNADGETITDYVPLTYSLPSDYALFIEEYKKTNSLWIVKPANRAQGRGIFIVTKLGQITKWAKQKWLQGESQSAKEQYIISKYVEDPFLIGSKKFDLRLFVLVTSYRPLRAYLHKEAFARFCTVAYNTDVSDLDNLFVHLTNVAVQRQGDDYNDRHGGKWSMSNLRLFLESTVGRAACDKLFRTIRFVITHSLKACQQVITNDRHCFELYGYDLLVDSSLRPWLIEVNASPSLSYTTAADRILKQTVVSDTLDIITPPTGQERVYKDHRLWPVNDLPLSGFEVLVDDTCDSDTGPPFNQKRPAVHPGRTK